MADMTRLDRIADAIRRKEAEQRCAEILEWKWIPEPERTKWRELAMTAALHSAREDVA